MDLPFAVYVVLKTLKLKILILRWLPLKFHFLGITFLIER